MTDIDHRPLAVQTFNACWDILEKEDAGVEDYRELLTLAFTSRWHWGFAGGLDQWITGDWMISRAASRYGDHALARALGPPLDLGLVPLRVPVFVQGPRRPLKAPFHGLPHHPPQGVRR